MLDNIFGQGLPKKGQPQQPPQGAQPPMPQGAQPLPMPAGQQQETFGGPQPAGQAQPPQPLSQNPEDLALRPMEDPKDARSMNQMVEAAKVLLESPEEKRPELFKKVAGALIQDNNKLAAFINPNEMPPEEQIKAMAEMKAPEGQEEQQGKGPTMDIRAENGTPEQTHEFISISSAGLVNPADRKTRANDGGKYSKLSSTVKTHVQKKLIEIDTDISDLDSIYDEFDAQAFTYIGQAQEEIAEQMDKFNLASDSQKELLYGRIQQRQKIERMSLIWRKYITGVAGGEKEMAKIEKTTLNPKLSPTQAKGAMDLLMRRTLRDREVYGRLLQRGILLDNTEQSKYSDFFIAERAKVEKAHEDYIKRFRKVNPGASAVDALRFKIRKTQLQKKQQPNQ